MVRPAFVIIRSCLLPQGATSSGCASGVFPRFPAPLAAVVVTVAAASIIPSSRALAATTTPSPGASPSASSTSPNKARDLISFGIGPANTTKVDGRANFNYLMPRGATQSDHLALVNLDTRPISLNLYAADVINGIDGSLALKPANAPATDVAAWVQFDTPNGKKVVDVPASTTVIIPFTVRVPKNAPVGDHMAGLTTSIVTQGQTTGEKGTAVNFEQRVATRLSVRVAGELRPQLRIENLSATYVGSLNPFGRGSAVVTYTVHNTGNVRLGGRQEVTVQSLFGPRAAAENLQDVPTLLPGATAVVTAEVPNVLPLVYLDAVVNVSALAPVTDADPGSAVATASVHLWAIPWTLLALVLFLLILALWWRRRLKAVPPVRNGRRERQAAEAQGPHVLVSTGSISNSPETSA